MTEKLLTKQNSSEPAFFCFERNRVALLRELTINVNGWHLTYDAGSEIPVEADLIPGDDYIITLGNDEVIRVTTDITGIIELGGFHYALGGNALGIEGGDSIPQINPYSIWDAHFRPTADPRGMTRVGHFWCDIFLMNTNPGVLGTSVANTTIADGYSNTPIGHDDLNYFTATRILKAQGKQLLSTEEFWAATYGVKERTSAGTKTPNTGLDPKRTSRFGLMQATGDRWTWAHDGHPDDPRSVIMGGYWANAAYSGSRSSYWFVLPSASVGSLGARGRCDHLILD